MKKDHFLLHVRERSVNRGDDARPFKLDSKAI